MGRTAGALGPVAEEGLAAVMSVAGDPAAAEEGPVAEGDGP